MTLAVAFGATAEPFRVIVPTTPDEEGAMARLVNYDTKATIDSVLTGAQSATFTGDIDESIIALVTIDGRRLRPFILESGTISFSSADNSAFGTMLNDQLRSFERQAQALEAQYRQASNVRDTALMETIYNSYTVLQDSVMYANNDNALGYYMFLNGDLTSLSAQELRDLLTANPAFAGYNRVQNMLAMAERRESSQPGRRYLDFEVTYNGKTSRLSDYMADGKYLLVDFWASWCGPCMRQLPVLKELYNRWHDKGLNVLGVAVWDEPADTERAIVSHELPWPCIIDAQSIPTDLYGIAGIPCIMLIGPDGVIISRDKQSEELIAEVDAAMEAATAVR